jgi:hypothetical protein
LLQRVRALEARVAALSGEARADRDHARLSVLLPAIAEVLDDRNFTAVELLSVYRRRSVRLDRALSEQCIDSGRELGQLFARCAGVPIAKLVLQQLGRERGGMLWALCIAKSECASNSTTLQEYG